MSIPKFMNGLLLFCGNTLALDCCPDDEEWYDDDDDDEYHSDYKPEPPCDPPTGPDLWGIYTLCPTNDCGSEPDGITLGVGGSIRPCSVAACLPSLARCARLAVNIAPPISGNMLLEVFTPIGVYSLTQDVVAGTTYNLYIGVEGDDQAAMFSNEGMNEFVSRATVSGPSGVRVRIGFTYIWTFDIEVYTDVASSRIPFVAPATSYSGIRLRNDIGEWVYWYRYVVGQYASSARAAEVLEGFDETIEKYIAECMCPLHCYETHHSFGVPELEPYNGVWDPGNDGCTPGRTDLHCTGTVNWYAATEIDDTTIRLQITHDDGQTWTTLATCTKGNDVEYSGSLGACSYFRVWLETQGGTGETFASGDFYPHVSSDGDCTEEIEDAFDAVPNA